MKESQKGAVSAIFLVLILFIFLNYYFKIDIIDLLRGLIVKIKS
jgi:hypothetical protein